MLFPWQAWRPELVGTFSPFFPFAVIMAPLANTPYIFPKLADNWRLRGPARGYAAAELELAAAERGH
jgi:hypothetical protein